MQPQNHLSFHISFRSDLPIYQQIAGQLRAMIVGGVLKNGVQLPTVRQVADTLGVNFNTVAKAYRVLDAEGLILAQQGRGSYVSAPASAPDRDRLRRQTLEQITGRYLAEVRGLGFSVQEAIALLEPDRQD